MFTTLSDIHDQEKDVALALLTLSSGDLMPGVVPSMHQPSALRAAMSTDEATDQFLVQAKSLHPAFPATVSHTEPAVSSTSASMSAFLAKQALRNAATSPTSTASFESSSYQPTYLSSSSQQGDDSDDGLSAASRGRARHNRRYLAQQKRALATAIANSDTNASTNHNTTTNNNNNTTTNNNNSAHGSGTAVTVSDHSEMLQSPNSPDVSSPDGDDDPLMYQTSLHRISAHAPQKYHPIPSVFTFPPCHVCVQGDASSPFYRKICSRKCMDAFMEEKGAKAFLDLNKQCVPVGINSHELNFFPVGTGKPIYVADTVFPVTLKKPHYSPGEIVLFDIQGTPTACQIQFVLWSQDGDVLYVISKFIPKKRFRALLNRVAAMARKSSKKATASLATAGRQDAVPKQATAAFTTRSTITGLSASMLENIVQSMRAEGALASSSSSRSSSSSDMEDDDDDQDEDEMKGAFATVRGGAHRVKREEDPTALPYDGGQPAKKSKHATTAGPSNMTFSSSTPAHTFMPASYSSLDTSASSQSLAHKKHLHQPRSARSSSAPTHASMRMSSSTSSSSPSSPADGGVNVDDISNATNWFAFYSNTKVTLPHLEREGIAAEEIPSRAAGHTVTRYRFKSESELASSEALHASLAHPPEAPSTGPKLGFSNAKDLREKCKRTVTLDNGQQIVKVDFDLMIDNLALAPLDLIISGKKRHVCACGRLWANGQQLGGHRGKCKAYRPTNREFKDVFLNMKKVVEIADRDNKQILDPHHRRLWDALLALYNETEKVAKAAHDLTRKRSASKLYPHAKSRRRGLGSSSSATSSPLAKPYTPSAPPYPQQVLSSSHAPVTSISAPVGSAHQSQDSLAAMHVHPSPQSSNVAHTAVSQPPTSAPIPSSGLPHCAAPVSAPTVYQPQYRAYQQAPRVYNYYQYNGEGGVPAQAMAMASPAANAEPERRRKQRANKQQQRTKRRDERRREKRRRAELRRRNLAVFASQDISSDDFERYFFSLFSVIYSVDAVEEFFTIVHEAQPQYEGIFRQEWALVTPILSRSPAAVISSIRCGRFGATETAKDVFRASFDVSYVRRSDKRRFVPATERQRVMRATPLTSRRYY